MNVELDAIDWEHLRHFTELAGTLNLTSAAARLQTSQVTVMRRVRALEAALGTTLFLRRRDGHRLTPAGAELLKSTREAQHLLRGGVGRVVARDTLSSGRVRIATTELAANWILLPALPSFVAKERDIHVEIDASPDVFGLTDDTETIALRFQRPQKGPFRIRKLGELRFSLFIGGSRKTSASEGVPVPYIGWAGHFQEIGIARWLRHIHEPRPPVVALTSFEGHLKAARLGIGAAAIPDFIGLSDPILVPIAAPHESFVLGMWIVVPEQIAGLVKVRKVVQFVEAAVARLRT